MRILKLTSNQTSFRTVKFRETGITLVVGRKKDAAEKRKDDTYNGVGKSLLLYLVNFCLASQPKEALLEKLPDWEFTLDFMIGESTHAVTRSINDQSKVFLDGNPLDLDKFRIWVGREVFGLEEEVPYLTFRSLIGQFLRSGKMAYQSYDRLNYSERPFQKALRIGFLLGLDLDLIRKKFSLKERLEQAVEMNQRFASDSIVRDYFLGEKDISIDLKELQDSLKKLEQAYADFRVAENYREVERDANEIRRQLQACRNEEYAADALLSQITKSLDERADMDDTRLSELYQAARVTFPDAVRVRLNEVANFHKNLLAARQKRLTSELSRMRSKLKLLREKQISLNADLNNKIKFLSAHGAFTEYQALSEKLAEKRAEVEKLLEFRRMTKEYKEQSRQLKLQMSTESIAAAKYLEEHEEEINAVTDLFRGFTKRVYPTKKSGLVITNNEGDNQTRFDIEAKILDDASDGINEVKIFCFDLMILLARQNHRVEFLFHDSRLFSDIDPRQRAELFRIAMEYSNAAGMQYFATLNEDLIEPMREWMTPEEFKAVIDDNVALELTDESASAKLLGIEVDLDYE
jgi:uncharacterized protein YydD (DUF2326 family)